METRQKWALVTGAAKRLGRSIALGLARSGANVVVHHGHSSQEAEETARDIEDLGVEAVPVQADLEDPAAVESLFETIASRCGRLDILVNSAASFRRQPLPDISVDDWDSVISLNLRAPWLCLRQGGALMKASGGNDSERGVVVNISDLTGVRPWLGYSHHGVSKAGLIHLTRIAARELAPEVRVNCVVPGAILPPPGMSVEDPGWKEKADILPLKRTGSPEAIVEAVLFLVRNSFVTGSVLVVDGGEQLLGGAPVA